MEFIERFFRFSEKGTDLKTEVMAGVTTFMTMAYIIFVNPAILSKTGMDFGAVMVATILASGITTVLMGLWVNYPFALAPGMGLNAYFTYTVVMQMGYSWQVALGAVFISGVCFLVLTFIRVRQMIVYAIPDSLKLATAAGIGLFIALIGLKEAGIIVANSATLVSLGQLARPNAYMTVLGLIIMGTLMGRGIKGAVLWGITINWFLGLVFGFIKFQGIFSMPPDISPIFMKLDIRGALNIGFLEIIFAFLFVDLFDTTGTLVGVAHQGGFTHEKGGFPGMDRALSVDAIGTILGSLLGTSTVTTYVESGAGVAVGGKTGLASVVTGLLFFCSLFIAPVARSIPVFATAPALIVVGVMMAGSVAHIEWTDFTESVPAFMVMISMPFTYSIATGIAVGFVFYPALKGLTGRYREVSPVMWVLAVLFVCRFLYLR